MSHTTVFSLTWAALLVNLVLTLRLTTRMRSIFDATHSPPVPTPPLGEPAPDFAADSLAGSRVRLSDYTDGQLTLVYLSPTCDSCRRQLPRLRTIRRLATRAGGDVVVVFADDHGRETVDQLRTEYGIDAEILMVGHGHELWRRYNPRRAKPFFFHIDGGILRAAAAVGSQEWADLLTGWQATSRSATGPAPVTPSGKVR
jgi:hypothetical protein